MLEKVIKKVRALNEPNPCKIEASYEPHQHTSDEVFMSNAGDLEGMSLTDAIGGIVADIAELKTDVQDALEDKADKVHTHEISDVIGLQVALEGKSPLEHTYFAVGNDVAAVECNILGTGVPGVNMYAANGSYLSAIKLVVQDNKAYVQIDGDYVSGNAIVNDLAASDDDEEKLPTTGAVVSALASKANTSHTQAISTITGLQGALDGKFDKSDIKTTASFPTSDTKVLSEKAVVNYIDNAIQPGGVIDLGDLQPSNPLDIDVESPDPTMGFHYGRLLFFTNNLGGGVSALNELLSSGEGREIHFHLNAADLAKRCNMIRIFKFAPYYDDPTRFEYFVEVAGAWDSEQ